MAGTWILCPNLWGARLFEFDSSSPETDNVGGIKDGIKFLREFPRPRIRTRLEDFHDDDEAEEISQPVEDPALERRVAEGFMGYLSEELEKAARKSEFEGLILCAEIHLLTIFQKKLGDQARSRLLGSVALDLYEVNETDLIAYVRDILETNQGKGRGAGSAA